MPHDIFTKQREINEVLSEITSALVVQFDMSKLLDQVVNTSRSMWVRDNPIISCQENS
jgi:hypothetical protein